MTRKRLLGITHSYFVIFFKLNSLICNSDNLFECNKGVYSHQLIVNDLETYTNIQHIHSILITIYPYNNMHAYIHTYMHTVHTYTIASLSKRHHTDSVLLL